MLSPTDELFDAINRDDIAAARDALSRGADLNAKDELGMTPLDLSIDLARNNISFLLLSMRSADSNSPGPAKSSPGGPAKSSPGTQVAQLASSPAKPDRFVRGGRRTMAVQLTTEARDAPAGEQTLPKLFAGNGGAPIPQAGFLGFGGR